ncbi:coiled-coil domain-containing protein 172 isoform X1 [Lissotriton helveticus]
MSLDSLFQHILLTEQQAQQKRRLMQEVKLETRNYHEKINVLAEELSKAKAELEFKVQDLSEKLFHQQLLKKRQDGLTEQKDKLVEENRQLLALLEDLEKSMAEEQSKFMQEVSDFNNAYALTNNRELLIKKQAKAEICNLEREACTLRNEMERMEQENVQLNALHLQRNSLKEELGELQPKLKGLNMNWKYIKMVALIRCTRCFVQKLNFCRRNCPDEDRRTSLDQIFEAYKRLLFCPLPFSLGCFFSPCCGLFTVRLGKFSG